MPLIKTLRASLQDFDTLRQTVGAGIEMNTSLLGLAERWFQNVEVIYPIAEMPINIEQRTELAMTVLTDMVQAVSTALVAFDADGDAEDIMPVLATTLDGLWRELTGVYASVLNARFAETTQGLNPEEILDQIRESLRQQAEMMDMDADQVREEILSHEQIRAELRQLGINPDAL